MTFLPWLRRIHMYLGLLSSTAIFVYGVTGIHASSFTRPVERSKPVPLVAYQPARIDGTLDDNAAAKQLFARLSLPLATPPAQIRRDGDNNLVFNTYPPSGMVRVVFLEKEGRARIEKVEAPFAQLLSNLHEITMRNPSADLRVRLWKYYNEFSTWTLLLLIFTGVWLWLASRPSYRWAQLCFALGSVGFAILFAVGR